MKLFVGLGNPGAKYERNRHNVGFMAVDRIAADHGFGAFRRRFKGLVAEGTIAGERVLILKPDTYMNESGQAVGEAARFLKISEADIVVLYDEIDLAPGKLKVKTGGGNAGHNGLRSISAHLSNDYVRVRIGVGHPGQKELVAHYVLHDFSAADRDWLDPLLEAISKSAGRLAKGDQARFLSEVARATSADEASKAAAPSPSDVPDAASELKRPTSKRHPSGERMSKRQSALAENLQKWLKGRDPNRS
ncbi:peptidyl-tRNA hydrolase [Filomicrobium insigne]|uniref:Peptidyl-tRNA hydrolase n=1 Tax=Filomicrobium insigne TaxID=418854 RepID=A0A1H0PWZ9_9HYPH|nr:aminoacyl-tRNA hydrolase [Filomicrobium insigne]SDP09008.1 peptidyl-tRNA hydrolase [Filomicrobium insigne]